MAYGWWGSRFPFGNLAASKFVSLVVWYRLATLRARNKLRQLVRQSPENRRTSVSESAEMLNWLAAGFDKINVGGGSKNLRGFINIDFVKHPHVEREIVANALDLSFVPSGCIAQVHSSHMLEHLRPKDIPLQLAEYRRILKPDGILTLRIPNTLGAAYAFWFLPILEDDRDTFVTLGFPSDEAFGDPRDGWLHKDLYAVLHWFYGDIGSLGNEHFTRFTPSFLSSQLESAGFHIRKMSAPEGLNLVVVAAKTLANSVRNQ